MMPMAMTSVNATKNWMQTRAVRSRRPLGESPNEPLRARAGGKEVTYHDGYDPAASPIAALMPKVAARSLGWLARSRSAVTRSCTPESLSATSRTTESSHAMMLTSTDSATKLIRSEPVVAPNTFWVLMLRTRMGVSASEKFMKFIVATTTIRNETQMSRYTVARLLALLSPKVEKCTSAIGVRWK